MACYTAYRALTIPNSGPSLNPKPYTLNPKPYNKVQQRVVGAGCRISDTNEPKTLEWVGLGWANNNLSMTSRPCLKLFKPIRGSLLEN